MQVLLFSSILLIGIGFLIKQLSKYIDFGIKLNQNTAFKFLLGWIVFGYILGLNYAGDFGCIVGYDPILEPKKTLFFVISFGLIFLAFITKNIKFKKIFLAIELSFWILKLMIFKGGYSSGFSGVPIIDIVFYDLVAIIVRGFILSELLRIKQFRLVKIGIIALLILGIKISIFEYPIYMNYRLRDTFEEEQAIRKELIGEWNGMVKSVGLEIEKQIKIDIDSSYIYLDSIDGFSEKYQLILDYSDHGIMTGAEVDHNCSVWIHKHNRDSLVMIISDFTNEYEFRLKKE